MNLDPIKPIDGMQDPWAISCYLLQKMEEQQAFYNAGRFFVAQGGQYHEYPHDELLKACLYMLQSKASQSKLTMITERLRVDLAKDVPTLPSVVPFKNGFFDLDVMDFIPNTSFLVNNRQHQFLPFNYDGKRMPVKWLGFLGEVFKGDEDRIQKEQCLQEFFGYCFLRGHNFHKALVLYGAGGNGKSVILDILAEMVPRTSRLEWGELGDQRSTERLIDSWLNLSTEIAYKETTGTTGFKKAIAGEPLAVNPKYRTPFEFKPFAKFAFATNGLPHVDDPSQGVFRRLIVLTLNNSFVGRENWGLTDELKEELAGIFNWAMIGAKRLVEQKGFTEVPSNILELAEYRMSINSLQSFCEEELTMREGDEMGFADFYRAYTTYCHETGNKPFARNKIRALIKTMGLPLVVMQTRTNERVVRAMVDFYSHKKAKEEPKDLPF
jgi:putative DNA primase/helicase